METYKYAVAFTFASENREYVEAVAKHLKKSGINVFYDNFEEIELWGKDLYAHLDDIYRNKARYCIMFISAAYKRKSWTNHERTSAQARSFKENKEYILPARFDNTEIPGVHPTTGYIDLSKLTPNEFAEKIIQKIGHSNSLQNRQAADTIYPSKPQSKTKHTRTPKFQRKVKPVVDASRPQTRTVNLNKEGIEKLPEDQPVLYKILTEGGSNNFTGAAKRGNIKEKIRKHLVKGKHYVPGAKVYIERMRSIGEAETKAARIIARTKPKYND